MHQDTVYLVPQTVGTALELLNKHNLLILASGTDQLIKWRNSPAIHSLAGILDISQLEELKYIKEDEDYIKIGALTTFKQIQESKLLKKYGFLLVRAVSDIGSTQIRNVATIGGNIANASPAADTLPALICSEAIVKIKNLYREREVLVENLFVGPGITILQPDELIVEIKFPKIFPQHDSFIYTGYKKIGQRNALSISVVSMALKAEFERSKKIFHKIIIGLGSVAPKPIRAKKTESYLIENKLTKSTILEAAEICAFEDCQPISDVRANASYRKQMVKEILKELLFPLL